MADPDANKPLWNMNSCKPTSFTWAREAPGDDRVLGLPSEVQTGTQDNLQHSKTWKINKQPVKGFRPSPVGGVGEGRRL